MILIKINDVKNTMSHLLVRETFDSLFLDEAEAVTFAKVVMRGTRNKAWYDSDELDENVTEYIRWAEAKSFFFEYIKGKKTPHILRISLKADENSVQELLRDSGVYGRYLEEKPDLFIQFRYEKNELAVVTGIAHREFVMDKTLEKAWDEAVKKWLIAMNIDCE